MNKKKQNELTKEIKELLSKEYLLPEEIIKDSEDQEEINIRLDIAKDRLIRLLIISDYVMINFLLDKIISNYFFKKSKHEQIKRPKIFQQHFLDRLTIPNKIDLLDEFFKLNNIDKGFILTLNGLRNAFAHSFFPQDRKREKAEYKKKSIYKKEVLRQYKEDYDKDRKSVV